MCRLSRSSARLRPIEPRRRAERALVSVVAECYVRGVSTQRVEGLVQTLGIERLSESRVSEMSKSLDEHVEDFRQRPLESSYPFLWLDALVVKSRKGGRVVNVAVVLAVGVNDDGKREILGVDVVISEDGAGWLAFLRGLLSRGLKGVACVSSDAHPGLGPPRDRLKCPRVPLDAQDDDRVPERPLLRISGRPPELVLVGDLQADADGLAFVLVRVAAADRGGEEPVELAAQL